MKTKIFISDCVPLLCLSALLAASNSCTGLDGEFSELECNSLQSVTLRPCLKECTKSGTADELSIHDINLFIYDENDLMDRHTFIKFDEAASPDGASVSVSLGGGRTYKIFAMANTGYDMRFCSIDELYNMDFYLPYPKDFPHGIPIVGYSILSVPLRQVDGKSGEFLIEMERLMAKISIRIDRSRLDKQADISIIQASVCNCPMRVKPFCIYSSDGKPSCIRDPSELFSRGYVCSDAEVLDLNSRHPSGLSDEISFYILENAGAGFNPDTSPYVELRANCIVDDYVSGTDDPMILRFYLREEYGGDIVRNSHYHFTIILQDCKN